MFITSFISILVLIVAGVTLLQEVFLFFLYRPYVFNESNQDLPRISVLIAMRNEEENVERCLQGLMNLKYPEGKMEILIGDDDSSDNTLRVLKRYVVRDERIRLFHITEEVGLARGKANVLAHLISHAQGDCFLITDADVYINPDWAKAMVADLPDNVGLVNGLTAVDNDIFQHMEWIQAQGMLHVLHRFMPVTAIGNNMMVTRSAYKATPGFENMSFSVTEDFALTREVVKKNYKLQSRLSKAASGSTLPETSWRALISQRKRWMQGAVRSPLGVVVMLIIRALYYPAIFILLLSQPYFAAGVFFLKAMLQASLIYRVNRETDKSISVMQLVTYEFYECILLWSEIIIFLIPGKVIWKGRKF
jgi:cellulose synthase/poly-beta-1,6-N-acetylglucosamine synthase-like glycosyltransferase